MPSSKPMKKEKLQKETKEERTVIKGRKTPEKRVSQEAREGQVSVGLNASKVTKGQSRVNGRNRCARQ